MPLPAGTPRPRLPRAKVAPPSGGGLISRPRLSRRLDQGRSGGVTILVAPGGSGKTSLVAAWLRECLLPAAWYALDEADRDGTRFLCGIAAALDYARPGACAAAFAALDAGEPAAAVVTALAACLEDAPTALVLDDFHCVDGSAAVVDALDRLLRYAPSNFTLVVLSRTVPALRFSSLLQGGGLYGLTGDDLRFEPDEAEQLLAAHRLPTEATAQLTTRSGGWAAGLLLLAQADSDSLSFLRGSGEAAFAALGADLLHALPPSLATFAMESAALCPASSEQIAALLARRDAAEACADLRKAGFFLTENQDGVLCYHALLADYLRVTLATESPERYRALRRQRAALCCNDDQPEQAASLLRADRDWEALSELVEREFGDLWRHGSFGTIAASIEALPADRRTPDLAARCGHAYRKLADFTHAMEWADTALAAAADTVVTIRALLLRVAILNDSGRYIDALPALKASARLAATFDDPSLRRRGEALAADTEGFIQFKLGNTAAGEVLSALAEQYYVETADTGEQARVITNRALGLAEAGSMPLALAQVERALPLWESLGDSGQVAFCGYVRALALLAGGESRTGQDELQRAADALELAGKHCAACIATAELALAMIDDGNQARGSPLAEKTLHTAFRLDDQEAIRTSYRAAIMAAIARKQIGEARRLLAEARNESAPPPDLASFDYLEGLAALRAGGLRTASATLAAAAAALTSLKRPHLAARALVLRAEAQLANGRVRNAEDALNAGARLAMDNRCEGYLLPIARYARTLTSKRRELVRLNDAARALLQRFAGETASIHLLDEQDRRELYLEVIPFGEGVVRIDGDELNLAPLSPKARELLYYLSLRGEPVRRETAMDALWAEHDGDRAARALSDAAHQLRCVLGRTALPSYQRQIRLHANVSDAGLRFVAGVEDTLATVSAGNENRASALANEAADYLETGAFLPWCESQWAAQARGHYLATGCRLAALCATTDLDRDLHTALARCCRALIGLDPLEEAGWEGLIRLQQQAGDHREAVRLLESYDRICREELSERAPARLRRLVLTAGSVAKESIVSH